jgi:hypothetical protein
MKFAARVSQRRFSGEFYGGMKMKREKKKINKKRK